jgi:hypothetical protein
MPASSTIFSMIDRLYVDYRRLSWIAKLFYPRVFREQLEAFSRSPNDEQARRVYEAAHGINFFQRFFFRELNGFFDYTLTRTCTMLSEARLLTLPNFTGLMRLEIDSLALWGIRCLKRGGILTQENLSTLLNHEHPRIIGNYISKISIETSLFQGNLAQSIFNDIIRHENINFGYFDALEHLDIPIQLGFLKGPHGLANLKAILANPHPTALSRAFGTFRTMTIVRPEGWGDDGFRDIYPLLQYDSEQANFDAIVKHSEPVGVARALVNLDNLGLLTEAIGDANRNKVVSDAQPQLIAEALISMSTLSQDNFDRLMANKAILLMPDVWSRIPPGGLISTRLARIFEIAETHRDNPTVGQAAVREHIHAILPHLVTDVDAVVDGEEAQVVRVEQSTHTASVHRSASESAQRLKASYGEAIRSHTQLLSELDSLSAFLNRQSRTNWFTKWFIVQPNLEKVEAAKRSLDRIRHPLYEHVDRSSGVSTQELIALIWVAIKDGAKRSGTLEEAQQLMIDALYETQREYNFSADGRDLGGNDRPACAGGTFSKFIEKFTGLHRDVELLVITRESAALKLQAVVKEEAFSYLDGLKSTSNIEELSLLLGQILAEDNENTVEPLWDKISERVADRLFEEFKSLYGDNKANPQFIDFIRSGEYVKLDRAQVEGLRVRGTTTPPSLVTPRSMTAAATPSQAGFFAASPEAPTPVPHDNGAGVGLSRL